MHIRTITHVKPALAADIKSDTTNWPLVVIGIILGYGILGGVVTKQADIANGVIPPKSEW